MWVLLAKSAIEQLFFWLVEYVTSGTSRAGSKFDTRQTADFSTSISPHIFRLKVAACSKQMIETFQLGFMSNTVFSYSVAGTLRRHHRTETSLVLSVSPALAQVTCCYQSQIQLRRVTRYLIIIFNHELIFLHLQIKNSGYVS